ncbi:indole-3-glycerol phosphate synthase [Nitzschia inconspicua]|uniref:Indole-3-glycerol phosphate synthase n=1 Tax=Nitzschia inconspicua TaxID=303405 RepID=A0A9K3KYG3_9STRA|nr:indole-3-glycerol phosphate synthase [Nitzschia inconspicua]
MKLSLAYNALTLLAWSASVATAFVSVPPMVDHKSSATMSPPSTHTALFAVSALVRKAKEAELRNYIQENGIDDEIKVYCQTIQEALKSDPSVVKVEEVVGPLQERLTRRKGTLTVIAEFKRKLFDSGYVRPEDFVPELLSSEFREFGAQGIAVLADERMGGCNYDDLAMFAEEQRRSKMEVPGPVPVINSDVIVDEFQIARTKAAGAAAVVLNLDLLGADDLKKMLTASRALELEAIVAVSSKEQAQQAIDMGARMISVVNVPGAEAKTEIVSGLTIPEGATVTKIANILHRADKGLGEVEEAWECRDKGFHCAWVSDALYKAGNSASEHPGAIIKSMSAKSSVRWASPVAKSGRGEGAREYLGDILM